jgi:drug/metabolite transporter superfamily protein YnfA
MVEYSLSLHLFGGIIIDKKRLDRQEIIGSIIALVGAAIIFYAPR